MNGHACRKVFRKALKEGKIKRPTVCSKCKRDDLPIKNYHEDYNEPLKIIWLCTECYRIKLKQKPNHFKGKRHSLDSRLSMSLSHQGIKIPTNVRQKISEAMTGVSAILTLDKKKNRETGEIGLYKLYRRYL